MESRTDSVDGTHKQPFTPRASWPELNELIRSGAYDQLERVLEAHRNTGSDGDDLSMAAVLDAAQTLCHTCSEVHRLQAEHQLALQQTSQLEDDTRTRLEQLLQSIWQAGEIGHDPPTPFLAAAESLDNTHQAASDPPSLAMRLTALVHRLTHVFRTPTGDWSEIDVVTAFNPLSPAIPDPSPVLDEPQPVSLYEPVPDLQVYCLGTFRVYVGDQLVNNWPSRKGKSILKYLLLQRRHPVSKEVLMETFWPDSDPEAARNNLNVAIYGLRQALRNAIPDCSHIIFQDESYQLNPDMAVWVDVEEFQKHLTAAKSAAQQGSVLKAVHEYEAAVAYYQGELLVEDRYEEWLPPIRQQLQDDQLNALDYVSNYYYEQKDYRACIAVCREILKIEPVYESIHRRLMRMYAQQNQHYLAIRQYQYCVEQLCKELSVEPEPQTTRLFETILRREAVTDK